MPKEPKSPPPAPAKTNTSSPLRRKPGAPGLSGHAARCNAQQEESSSVADAPAAATPSLFACSEAHACGGSDETHACCVERLAAFAAEHRLPFVRKYPPGTSLLFHVRELSPTSEELSALATTLSAGKGRVVAAFDVSNPITQSRYALRKMSMEHVLGHGHANERTLYHASKANMVDILTHGLDPLFAHQGFFGRGVYLTDSPLKANDYSGDKGNPATLRMLLQCRTLLGRVHAFELGIFDRELIVPPPGYDSVQGFLRRNYEFVVYRSDQVCIDRIIFYTFTEGQEETLTVPPDAKGRIVFITAALSEFFSKLKSRAAAIGGDSSATAVQKLTGLLLRRIIDVDTYIARVSVILMAAPPSALVGKIRAELERSQLDVISLPSKTPATPLFPSLQPPPPTSLDKPAAAFSFVQAHAVVEPQVERMDPTSASHTMAGGDETKD